MKARTTTTLLLALAAGLAAGCGSDEEQGAPIPADSAAALERQLASIEGRFGVGGGACGDITGGADPNTTAVQSVIDSLPQDVDADVRQALQEGFDRLFTLTEEQCDEQEGQETTPQDTTETEAPPTETSPTETTPTETTPTETTPTETTPTEEAPTEPVPPEDGEQGNGGAVSPGDEG